MVGEGAKEGGVGSEGEIGAVPEMVAGGGGGGGEREELFILYVYVCVCWM